MAASCFGFRTTSLPFRKFEDPFERFLRLGHIHFDLVVFRMSDYAWKTNFWCQILIDELITNQIALLLPVRGRTEFGIMFGIDCRRFLFSPCHLLSLLVHPLHTSPDFFFFHPRRAPSLACSISAWKRKGNGCYAGYRTPTSCKQIKVINNLNYQASIISSSRKNVASAFQSCLSYEPSLMT